MAPSIGRKFKRKRKKKDGDDNAKEVTPDGATSSPSKEAFAGLITELRFVDKESKFARLNTSIKALLESVCDDEEQMREYALYLLESIRETETHVAVPGVSGASSPVKEAPTVTIVESSIHVQYNPQAFRPGRTTDAARQQKKRKVDSISACLSKIGNAQQQLLCLHGFLSKYSTEPNSNPVVVGAINAFNGTSMDGRVSANIREVFSLAHSRSNTLDRRTFLKTILMAIVPSEMPSSSTVSKMYGMLGYKNRKTFVGVLKEAVANRKELFSSPNAALVQQGTHKKRTIFTPSLISKLHDWVLHKCDLVVSSPCHNESILVKDLFTGEKKRVQKHYYVSSVRELHNELIMEPDLGGFLEARNSRGEVVISDTTLRSLLPKQLSRLTDSQKQMCGCEICIIAREYVKTLSAWITRIASEVDNETANSLRIFSSRYESPKDIISDMTCQQVDGLSKLHCSLCRCADCPQLAMPALLTDNSPSAKLISFQCYEYQSYCTIHKSLEGAPTTCALCNEASENEPVGKLPRKQHLTKKRKLIGVFITEYFLPMMRKYRFHVLHVALLGKHHCVSLRRQMARETPGSLDTQRDYADALVAEFTNEIQSTHFGENASISMEGVTSRFDQDNFHYHCYVSDDKRQDARTTHVNQQHLIDTVRDMNLLPPKTGILFELMDGCAKQYRSGLALYLMSLLSYQKDITIDRMISAPHHGKGDCDSQGGIDKNHLRRYFRMTAVPELDIGKGRSIEAHTYNEDGKKASMAERMTAILSSEERRNGSKGDKKHQKREGNAKIQERHYHVQHHGNTDSEANAPLKLLTTKFVTEGFPTVSGQKQNGLQCHYHFLACPELGAGKIAARRIPCACNNCRLTLGIKWENGMAPEEQPRFQTVVDCKYRGVLGNLNDWKILTITHNPKAHSVEELEEVYEDVLGEHEASNSRLIDPDNFGAYGAGDEYYLVKWTTESFALQADNTTVEGMGGNNLPSGTIVAKGVYWNGVGRAKRWYTPPSRKRQRLFRVRYVVDPKVTVEAPSETVQFPTNRKDRAKVLRMKPLRVERESHNKIMDELARRARLDYEEGAAVDAVAGEDVNGDESEEEEDDSSSEDDDDDEDIEDE